MNRQACTPEVIVDDVERSVILGCFPARNITVLKDAASTSIYGMRGANGVIMATTKREEAGRARISLTHEMVS